MCNNNYNSGCSNRCNSGCGANVLPANGCVANAIRNGCGSNVLPANGCGCVANAIRNGCAGDAIRNGIRQHRCCCCCCCRKYGNDRQMFAGFTSPDPLRVIPTGVFEFIELTNESQGNIALVNEGFGVEVTRGVYEVSYGFNVSGAPLQGFTVGMYQDASVIQTSIVTDSLTARGDATVSKTFLVNVVSETALLELVNNSTFDIHVSNLSLVIKRIGYAQVL